MEEEAMVGSTLGGGGGRNLRLKGHFEGMLVRKKARIKAKNKGRKEEGTKSWT
jgi:hypothetical protein